MEIWNTPDEQALSYSGNHHAGSAQRWKKRHFKDWSIFHRLVSFRLTVTGESETCTLQYMICRLKKCGNENSWQPQRQRTPKSYPFILLSKCNAEKSHLDFYYTLKYLLLVRYHMVCWFKTWAKWKKRPPSLLLEQITNKFYLEQKSYSCRCLRLF